mmetsp:Transcript_9304/g.18162  ORF Transcript_9304/g.18162 Transcript_9304/m.18162 type:complete len:203 (+) Transcript_9304:164-772(+)
MDEPEGIWKHIPVRHRHESQIVAVGEHADGNPHPATRGRPIRDVLDLRSAETAQAARPGHVREEQRCLIGVEVDEALTKFGGEKGSGCLENGGRDENREALLGLVHLFLHTLQSLQSGQLQAEGETDDDRYLAVVQFLGGLGTQGDGDSNRQVTGEAGSAHPQNAAPHLFPLVFCLVLFVLRPPHKTGSTGKMPGTQSSCSS